MQAQRAGAFGGGAYRLPDKGDPADRKAHRNQQDEKADADRKLPHGRPEEVEKDTLREKRLSIAQARQAHGAKPQAF